MANIRGINDRGRTSHRRRRGGFTVIELLVVIAIIALLAAILLPAFAAARAKARQSDCMSNLHQIAIAVQAYSQDYDEHIVHTELGGDIDDAHESYWGDMLFPYLRDWKVITCPEASQTIQFKSSPPSPARYTEQWSYNYGINDIIAGTPACSQSADSPDCQHIGVAGQNLAAVTYPADTVLIADSLPASADTGDGGAGESNQPGALSHARHEINWEMGHRNPAVLSVDGKMQDGYPRHQNGFVLVMTDGHASWRHRELIGDAYVGGTRDQEWVASRP